MSFFKIKLRKTDRLWTRHIRIRENYTCQKPDCQRVYSFDDTAGLQNLGVSHFHGRGHENTRFDDDNCIALCNFPCHKYWGGEGRKEYEAFMIERLGQERFDLLMLRAHIRKDRDDAADLIILRQLLKQETAGALGET